MPTRNCHPDTNTNADTNDNANMIWIEDVPLHLLLGKRVG